MEGKYPATGCAKLLVNTTPLTGSHVRPLLRKVPLLAKRHYHPRLQLNALTEQR